MKSLVFGIIMFSAAANAIPGKKDDVTQLRIRNTTIKVEVAETPAARTKGLMFRKSLKNDEGMLFIFDHSQPLSFWMRNTLIPLSIGYFNDKQELINTLEMVPASDLDLNPPHYSSAGPAKYALEMNKGWFAQHQIVTGDKFEVVSSGRSKLLKRTVAKPRP